MTAATRAGGTRRLVELFAGIGLVAEAFGTGADGSWETVLANDICRRKAAMYRLNHSGETLLEASLTMLRADAIPEADAWWASSPCQDVSAAGRRKGVIGGARSSLAFNVVKLLRAAVQRCAAPAVVTFENVPGLLADPAEFGILVEALQACGYRAGAVVMDAAKWLPADRARVFLVGVRKDVAIPPACIAASPQGEWTTPALVRAYDHLRPEMQCDWLWWGMPDVDGKSPELASLLEADPGQGRWLGAGETSRFLAMLNRPGQAKLRLAMEAGHTVHGVTVEKMASRPVAGGKRDRVSVFRQDIAFTLLASATGSSRQRLVQVDGTRIRLRDFTPREVARLMGVRESFVVPETIGRAMTAFGDAVAIPVVRHLVRHLIEPLVDSAAVPRAASRPGKPEGWRRPIKTKTVGVMTYLGPDAHVRLKGLARQEGLSMAQLVLDSLDLMMVSRGREPLSRYAAARLPRGRPGAAAAGRDSATTRQRADGRRTRDGGRRIELGYDTSRKPSPSTQPDGVEDGPG